MQLVRSHNFGTGSGDFLLIHEHEWHALWGLPAWTTRLWCCLVAFSDFKAGTVRTSYGELLNALQPDQPAAGKRLAKITLKQVRDAIAAFERLLILGRDKSRNEEQRALFFQVAPRTGSCMSAGKKGRDKGRTQSAGKADEHGEKSAKAVGTEQGTGQVFQENSLNTPYPQERELSTGTEPGPTKKQAPPGGQNLAPSGHAPRPAGAGQSQPLDSRTIAMRAAALSERLRGRKTDPPRGRAHRPPSGASEGVLSDADDG